MRKGCLMDTEPSTKHRGHAGVSLIHKELCLLPEERRGAASCPLCPPSSWFLQQGTQVESLLQASSSLHSPHAARRQHTVSDSKQRPVCVAEGRVFGGRWGP